MAPIEVPQWLARLWLLAGALGVALALVGGVVGWLLIGSAAQATDRTLELTLDTLETAAETAAVTGEALDEVAAALRTGQQGAADAAVTLTQVAAVSSNLSDLLAEDVPEGLEAVRDTLPPIIASARIVDTTLRALSLVGVDYNPPVPLNEALDDLDSSLAAIPEDLRSQAPLVGAAAERVSRLGGDTLALAEDLGRVRARLLETASTLAGYETSVEESSRTLADLQRRIAAQAGIGRWVVAALAVAVAGGQTLPLFVGWWMRSRQRAVG